MNHASRKVCGELPLVEFNAARICSLPRRIKYEKNKVSSAHSLITTKKRLFVEFYVRHLDEL